MTNHFNDPFKVKVSPVIFALENQTGGEGKLIGGDACTRNFYATCCHSLMKIHGLMVFGHDKTTMIHNIKVGNKEMLGSYISVPAAFFDVGFSFDDLKDRVYKGEESGDLERLKFSDLNMTAGLMVAVKVTGPCDKVVMWGEVAELR